MPEAAALEAVEDMLHVYGESSECIPSGSPRASHAPSIKGPAFAARVPCRSSMPEVPKPEVVPGHTRSMSTPHKRDEKNVSPEVPKKNVSPEVPKKNVSPEVPKVPSQLISSHRASLPPPVKTSLPPPVKTSLPPPVKTKKSRLRPSSPQIFDSSGIPAAPMPSWSTCSAPCEGG
eukprot:829658-Prorocentrum_minimum.AAC.1